MLRRIGHFLHLGWRVVTELHTAQWVALGVVGIVPASALSLLASFWGEHSATLVLLAFVITFCAIALLGLGLLGSVSEAIQTRASPPPPSAQTAENVSSAPVRSPQIESGDVSDLIEQCWNDHVPNSALARDTLARNVAHAMKEDLKLRLRAFLEAIKIGVGEGAPRDTFTESLHTRNHLIKIAVTTRKTATSCRVILEHITGPVSSRCPVIIRANFTINAGDTEYLPIAEFVERLDTSHPPPSKPGLIQVHSR
jgi:hypothetical protein